MAKHIPERMCIACRQMYLKPHMIKIVSRDGIIEIDESQKKFGRGAYICKSMACIDSAQKKKTLSRHFKRQVDTQLYENIKELLDG